MIKRTLYFGNPVRLSLEQQQLKLEFRESPAKNQTIPIEDIGLVVLDHWQISLTQGAVNALIDNNAALLWCDSKHLPHGLVLPMAANHAYTEKLRYQIGASEPLKKQLWKQTIQSKITNQLGVLDYLGAPVDNMRYWASNVKSGDTDNLEGRAAAYYWQLVFSEHTHFRRKRHGAPPNHMLNYGYAILRSIVARSLVSSGMLPALGIFHRNKYNPFCLADDVMEPYRPLVDKLVVNYVAQNPESIESEELSADMKKVLLQIPILDVEMDGGRISPLMVATQRTTASLMDCYEGTARKIAYPELK